MRNKKLKLIIILVLGYGLTGLHAQISFNTTGSNALGSGGSMSYSIGQVVNTYNAGISGSVAHGVQNPHEITVVTEVEQVKGMNLSVTAYPNPTTNNLTLSIKEPDISDITYQLFDMNGNLLQTKNISDSQTNIVFSNLEPATYFVKVIKNNNDIKSFKVIKN